MHRLSTAYRYGCLCLPVVSTCHVFPGVQDSVHSNLVSKTCMFWSFAGWAERPVTSDHNIWFCPHTRGSQPQLAQVPMRCPLPRLDKLLLANRTLANKTASGMPVQKYGHHTEPKPGALELPRSVSQTEVLQSRRCKDKSERLGARRGCSRSLVSKPSAATQSRAC